jgi:hypothetical protein
LKTWLSLLSPTFTDIHYGHLWSQWSAVVICKFRCYSLVKQLKIWLSPDYTDIYSSQFWSQWSAVVVCNFGVNWLNSWRLDFHCFYQLSLIASIFKTSHRIHRWKLYTKLELKRWNGCGYIVVLSTDRQKHHSHKVALLCFRYLISSSSLTNQCVPTSSELVFCLVFIIIFVMMILPVVFWCGLVP